MQIDFHHAVTYVAARLAGFEQPDAETIAYAAQYVDDATSSGTVHFHNNAIYNRISSAHGMLDKRNTKALANHQVWLPFHFLPGNGGRPAGENPDGKFINKIICRPDSPVAQDMVAACINNKEKAYSLHQLGITMHIYADTWAHQHFAGVLHPVNAVEDAQETSDTGVFDSVLGKWLRDALDDIVPPLGHGQANVFPDMPFISWEFTNGREELIQRNNTEDFCAAANKLCIAMQQFRIGDSNATVNGIDLPIMERIRNMFLEIKEKEGEKRHAAWLDAIAQNEFGFGNERISYAPRGKSSWKREALGVSQDLPVHTYQDSFITSDWKMFHDATQAHRFHMVHDILPRYGICAA